MSQFTTLDKKPTINQLIRLMSDAYSIDQFYFFYNDKLKDGTNSIKVIGWDINKYLETKKLLERHNYIVSIKKIKSNPNSRFAKLNIGKYTYRLHVREKENTTET
jgi:hypothetical protein